MSSIEEILWNIFTFYSLTANPKDPYRIHYTALLKICKDIMTMDASMTEHALTQADLHLLYTSTVSSPTKKVLWVFSMSIVCVFIYLSNRIVPRSPLILLTKLIKLILILFYRV